MLRKPLSATANLLSPCLHNEVVSQLRARVPHQRAMATQTSRGPTLFDEEDNLDEVGSHRQRTIPHLHKKYAMVEAECSTAFVLC